MFSLKNTFSHVKVTQYQLLIHIHNASTTTRQPIQMSYTAFESPKSNSSPLIIMHGMFGSKENWNSLSKALLKQLNPQRNIFAVDARNHGNSKHTETHTYEDLVEDIRFFMNSLKIDRASFIGHSMGGRAGMLCALKYPNLIDKLIVADMSPVSDVKFESAPKVFDILQNVQFPSNVSFSQARAEVDKWLAGHVESKAVRDFLLTNLTQREDGSYGWKVNVPLLADSFLKHIAKFPDVGDATFKEPVLLVAGATSDFVRSNYSTNEIYQPVEMSYVTYETDPSKSNEAPSSMIVIHGLLGSSTNWSNICKSLAKTSSRPLKIFNVDARNHGRSPHSENHTYEHLVADVKALIEKLNLKKASLMGHSMGGRAIMLGALKYPSLVDKLVVVDMSPFSIGSEMLAAPAIMTVLKNVKMPENVSLAEARRQVGAQLAYSPICSGLKAFLLTNLAQKDQSFKWKANIPVLLNSFYKHITTFPDVGDARFDGPVLFVGGASSEFLPKKDHPQIKKLFPNAEIVYIDGAGHWLHVEKPAEFLRVCSNFLNK